MEGNRLLAVVSLLLLAGCGESETASFDAQTVASDGDVATSDAAETVLPPSLLLHVDFDSPPEMNGEAVEYIGPDELLRAAITGGARLEHAAAGGWNGSGAAKIFPPTTADNYGGFGAPTISNRQVGAGYSAFHIRFLVRYGPAFASSLSRENKMVIIQRTEDTGGRAWLSVNASEPTFPSQYNLAYYGTLGYNHGGDATCGESPCAYLDQERGASPASNCAHCNDEIDRCGNDCPPFVLADHIGEWIAVEFSANDAGRVEISIWTRDGAYSGLFLATGNGAVAEISGLDKIGGYFNGASSASDDNYYLIDEVVVAAEPIGPPAGFLQ